MKKYILIILFLLLNIIGYSQTFTFGSSYQVGTSSGSNYNKVWAYSATKFIVAYYQNGGTVGVYVQVGTVSGSSISYSTPVNLNMSVTNNIQIVGLSDNTFAVFGYAYSSPYTIKAKVCTINNDAVTVGGTEYSISYMNGGGITYRAIKVGSNKFLVAHSDYSNSYKGTCVIGTVSGTSITIGSANIFRNFNIGNIYLGVDLIGTDKVLFAVQDGDPNSNYYDGVVLATISDLSITVNSYTGISTSSDYPIFITTIDDSKFILTTMASTTYYARVGTLSGSSISFGSTTSIGYVQYPMSYFGIKYDASKFVITYTPNSIDYNNGYTICKVGTISGSSVSFDSGYAISSDAALTYQATNCALFPSTANIVVGNISYGEGKCVVGLGPVSGKKINGITYTKWNGISISKWNNQ